MHRSVTVMLDEEDERRRDEADTVDVEAWTPAPPDTDATLLRAGAAGFLQQVDLKSLAELARSREVQITLHHAPGDFLVPDEIVMSARPAGDNDRSLLRKMRDCITQGANRTDVQDVLFLSDQLVEVLGRALSPGINDPHTAMLCLDWLHGGLVAFVRRPPARSARRNDPVLYRRVTFEDMLNKSFDEMRQYVASDTTVTLHALSILGHLAATASHPAISDACIRQMRRLAASAKELLREAAAHEEIETAIKRELQAIARRRSQLEALPAATG